MSSYEKRINVLDSGFVTYIDHMGDDAAIPQAARVSYQKGTKSVRSDEDLIRFLMRHEHYSPFAMCQIKLHVRLPIFVHNQWIRHDRFAWNMMSGRYSEMPDEKWTPTISELRAQGATNKQVGEGKIPEDKAVRAQDLIAGIYSENVADYQHLLELGVCREQARTILPMGQYTEGFVTANLGDWMLFLKQRLDSHAQKEIQVYAEAVLEILTDLFPISMRAFIDYQVQGIRLSSAEYKAVLDLLRHKELRTEPYTVDEILMSPPQMTLGVEENLQLMKEYTEQASKELYLPALIPNKRERQEFLEKIKI